MSDGRFAAGRHAGTLVPLFSIPSRGSWGIGEISDLPVFARWLDAAGRARGRADHAARVRPVTICYRCDAEYRDAMTNPRHRGYDPHVAERYAQKKTVRRMR